MKQCTTELSGQRSASICVSGDEAAFTSYAVICNDVHTLRCDIYAIDLLQELHLARESQAKAYGLSWGSAASAPPLPPGGPAVYGLVADASLQGRQAEYAAWHARARLPAAPYPELKADANPHIPGQ